MTKEDLKIILESNIPSDAKAEILYLFTHQDNQEVKFCQEGSTLEQKDNIDPDYNTDISISGKSYKVAIAETDEEKEIGLSKITSLPENCGMLFIYEEPQEEVYYTMADTSVDLDIIFIDESGEVISVHPIKAHAEKPVSETDVLFVLELNINSGVKSGDDLEGIEEAEDPDDSLTDEEKETAKSSKMLVLDENGDVQMKLEGGERIFSRISTRKFIKAAIKAFRSDSESDYKKVGKLVFNELNALDGREAEYVTK